MDGTAFINNILQTAQVADARSAPYIAFVDSMPTSNTALIYRLEEDVASAFEAKVLTPFVLRHDDVVLAVQIGRSNVVLGRIEPITPSWFMLRAGLRLWNSGDLRMFSDEGVDQTIWLDNDLGEGHFVNIILTGSLTATSMNSPVFTASSASNATVGSTTNTTTYQEALATDLTLPTGSWAVYAFGGASLAHNASGSVNMVVEIDGVIDTARTVSMLDAGPMLVADNHSRTVVGDRDVTIRTMYKASTAGTVTCKAPFIIVSARRTA
jgi:hypothetical protein